MAPALAGAVQAEDRAMVMASAVAEARREQWRWQVTRLVMQAVRHRLLPWRVQHRTIAGL